MVASQLRETLPCIPALKDILNRRHIKTDPVTLHERLWNVRVVSVRTQTRKGKPRRTRTALGHTSDWKKAIVSLVDGHKIDVTTGL